MIYGHAYGDKALKSLADSMKAFFPPDALLGRNGGDEFCILLPDCTFEEADAQLNHFTRLPKTFSYKGIEQHFLFLLDMRNIRHLPPTIHSLCAVQMQPFMK